MSESELPHEVPKKGGGAVWALLLVLLGGGGAAAYFLLGKEAPPQEAQSSTPETSAAATTEKPKFEHAPPPPPPPPPSPGAKAASADAGAKAAPQAALKPIVAGPKNPGKPSACASPCQGKSNPRLESALAVRARQARGCYNTALRQDEMLSGKLTVKVRVSPTGSPCSVSITNDTLGSPTLNACVISRFKAAAFPPPVGGCLDLAVPVSFVANK